MHYSPFALCLRTLAAMRSLLTAAVLLAVMAAPVSAQTDGMLHKRLKVGLVLGGGGAKGAAEVGVLKVIEEAGIPIDYIAGTSIGSIVGALYSVGYRAETLDSLFCSQEWLTLLADREVTLSSEPIAERDGITYIFGFPVSRKGSKKADPTFGAVRGDNIVSLFQNLTQVRDSINFNELPIPFRCVAADVKSWSEVVLDRGNLPRAMRASMAIPGAFKPVRIGKMVLVDGGLLNNLPVDVVRKMGADVVIAIDLAQEKPGERHDFSLKDTFGIGGVIDWVVSRPDVKKYHENRAATDLYINPDLGNYGVTSFSRESIIHMIDLGEREGRNHWKALLDLKRRIGL